MAPGRCSRAALLLTIELGERSIFRLITPVGVFALASERSCLLSLSVHGGRERRSYLGLAPAQAFGSSA